MVTSSITEQQTAQALVFGPFRLDIAQRALTRGGEPVPIQPRVLELLIYMAANPGRLLLKDELLQAMWPDSFVEESNLSQSVFQLRKALGNGEAKYVQTVSGRGYLFIASVETERQFQAAKRPSIPLRGEPVAPALPEAALPAQTRIRQRTLWVLACAAAAVLAAAVPVWRHYRGPRPPEHIGTDSADAYRAVQLGSNLRTKNDELGAQRAYQMATRLDPNYAFAHAELAASYQTTNQLDRAREEFARAHQLSGTASAADKIFIESQYDQISGDWESAVQDYRLAAELYPANPTYPGSMANALNYLGRYPEAVAAARKAYALKPAGVYASLLALTLKRDNQPEESLKVAQAAMAQGQTGWMTQVMAVQDFLVMGDSAAAERGLAAAEAGSGKNQAIGYRGRLESSRGHFAAALRQWKESDLLLRHTDQAGTADDQVYLAVPYLVIGGEAKEAEQLFAASSSASTDEDRALCLALLGRKDEAKALMAKLRADRPRDTIVNFVVLPEAEAVMALAEGRPADAVTALKVTVPYDLHDYASLYWRGQAYLALADGKSARQQFDAILHNPGIDPACPLYPLAWLGRARAERLLHDTASARRDYQKFLEVWRDADNDVPQLGEARRELASLPSA